MANCIKCGNVLGENVTICPVCGTDNTQVIQQPTIMQTTESVQPIVNQEVPVQPVVNQEVSVQVDSNVQNVPNQISNVTPVAEVPTSVVQPEVVPQVNVEVPVIQEVPITNVQEQIVTPPVTNDNSKKKNILPIILGVFIVILLIVIVILIILLNNSKSTIEPTPTTPTPTPTEKKEELKEINVQLGEMSFDIPEDWKFINESSNRIILFHKKDDVEDIVIYIDLVKGSYYNLKEDLGTYGVIVSKEEEVKLNHFDNKGKYIQTSGNGKLYDLYYIPTFPTETMLITIAYASNEDKTKYEDNVKKVLDTLKYKEDIDIINDPDEYTNNINKFKLPIR